MSATDPQKKTIGLPGAIFTIVGFVVGISIFILPGQIASLAGPGVVLSYGIAGIGALFSCLVAAQISALVPRAGAGFLSVATFLSPFWGFILVWLMFGGVSLAVALLGYGFADYLDAILPGMNRQYVAAGVVLVCGSLNLLGASTAVWVQGLLVVLLILVLGVFSGAGLASIVPDNLTPFLPNGWTPVLTSAVPAFFSFAGFMMIIELGGEIRNPQRNVPHALFWSFIIVGGFYMAVSMALVGIIPWYDLKDVSAPIALAAGKLFPPYAITIVSFSALVAAATSINAMVLGYSRYVVPLGKTKMVPGFIAWQSEKYNAPVYGILFIVLLALAAVFMESTIIGLATGIVIALMGTQVLIGLALLLFHASGKQKDTARAFDLGRRGTYIAAIGLITISVIFMLLGMTSNGKANPALAAYVIAGALLYWTRIRSLGQQATKIGHLVQAEALGAADR